MSIARNAGYNLAGSILPLAVSIVTVPIYIRVAGVERYGVLALCWLILGFMNFLNLGMGPAVSQRLASLHSAEGEERAQVFWTAVWLNLSMGAVGALAVLFLAGAYFSQLSDTSPLVAGEMPGAIPWLALMIPVVMLSGVLSGALQGRERFLASNLIDVASSVLMSVLPLVFALIFGPRLGALIAGAMLGKGIALALSLGACVRAVPLAGPRRPTLPLVRQLVSFGGWVTITSLVAPLVLTMDRFLIGAIAGAAAVSIYSIPYNLVSRMSILPLSLASAIFPRFAASSGEDAATLQAESVSALVAVLTPLTILGIAGLAPFLHFWIGRELAVQAAPLGYIFASGFWMNSVARVPYAYLEARGRPDLIAKLVIAYVPPYFLLLWLLLNGWGVVGAAVAWSVRSFFDPSLFLLSGSFRRMLPVVTPPGALVYAAMFAALFLPWTAWPHWLAMAALLGASIALALRTAPHSLRAQASRLLRRGASIPEDRL
jgi:O-antigen/teichoic acid export membrane protein